MKNISYITSTLIILFLLSCTKASKTDDAIEQNKDLPSILNYLTAVSTPVDMQFNLSSTTSMLTPGNNTTTQLLFGTALNSSQQIVNVGSLSINNIDINPVDNFYEKSFNAPNNFFGKKLVFKTNIVTTPLTTGFQFIDSLYSPNEIRINQSTINQELALNKIFPNKNIQWAADPNNTAGGIIIVAEYDPQGIFNANFKQSNPKFIRNGIVVPDNGSTNIDNSLFVGMPIGAYLSLTLVRASYKKGITNGLKSYLICSYSKTFMDFKYQP